MAKFQGEIFKDDRGREVVCFTTPSGVTAIVDTSIPAAAILQLIDKLTLKLARRKGRPASDDKVRC